MNTNPPHPRAISRAIRSGFRRSLPTAFAVVVGGFVGMVGAGAVPGLVHAADNTLVSSSPAAGTTVDTSPASLLLTFANPLGATNDVQVVCGGSPVRGGAPDIGPGGG